MSVKKFKRPGFIEQESLLTPVLESRAGGCFLGIYIVSSIVSIAYFISLYFLDGGKSWAEDWSIVETGFKGFPMTITTWLMYHAICYFVVYPVTVYGKSRSLLLQYLSWFIGCFFWVYTGYLCFVYNWTEMGMACKAALGFESVRLLMKVVSFMKEVPLLTQEAQDSDITLAGNNNEFRKPVEVTSLKHYTYFLFCPTAIYSPSYPMKKTRNWSRFFLLNYLNFTIAIMCLKLCQIIAMPESFGKQPIPLTLFIRKFYIVTIFYSLFTLVGMAIFWLHNWQNIWSELLRFGDRRFYADYYTAHDIALYFRKWNHVIQGWLYRYIFQVWAGSCGNTVTSLLVMAISGVAHDYVMYFASGLITPFYTLSFPLIVLIAKISPQTDSPNLLHFMNLALNHFFQGTLHFIFILEIYSRRNCPVDGDQSHLASLFIPRFPSCLQIDTTS